MAQPWMTRELAGLEVDITSADISSSYATHITSRNKHHISDTSKENNLPPTQTDNDTHDDGAATPSNLCSLPRGSSELITLMILVRTLLECDAISTAYKPLHRLL